MAGARSRSSSRGKVSAGLGGAGSGTALVAIAQQLGTDTWPGLTLMYCAPAIAVLFGAFVNYLQMLARWATEASVVRRARKTIDKQLKDPNISPEHKEVLRTKLEDLNTTVIDARIEQVKRSTK